MREVGKDLVSGERLDHQSLPADTSRMVRVRWVDQDRCRNRRDGDATIHVVLNLALPGHLPSP